MSLSIIGKSRVIQALLLKLYVSALNPYTFHDLNVLDPEVGSLGYTMGATHSMVKSFIGGIEVSF